MNSILPFYKKNIGLLFYLCFLFFGINYGWSQTTTVFSETFDRGSVVQPITNGGSPSMTYTTATTATGSPSATGATSRTNSISGTDYALQILPGNSSATPTAQTAGQTYVTGALSSYSSPFGATLSSSPGPITWTFNMKTNRTTALSGFAASGYASAVVLAATSSTLHTVGNGYAVIEIKGTTTNTFKLIKYTNGLGGTQTVIAAPASDFLASNSSWASIRVVYTPSTNNWQLFLRDDTTAPVSPLTGVTTQAGSTVSDNTYTTSASSIFGFYFSHSAIGTPTSNTALFDNFNVSVTSLGPTITGATTTAAFTTTYGTSSAAQTFTVGGNNLGANLVATAPTGFEVATDGSTYGATATFTSSGGTLSIRLKATASAGSYNSQNIVLSSTGATSVNITTPITGNTISAKALTIMGLTGTNKSYDGTTTATFIGTPYYSGLVNSESYSVSGTASASFTSAAIGTVKAITVSGYTAPTSNYTLTQPSLSANITAVPLTITGLTGNNKVYDGTISATLSGTPSYSGLVNNESYSVSGTASASFADAAVGTGKTISVSGYTAPSNYTITQPTLTANITQKTLTISGISVGNKVYDGSASATISGSPTLVGVLNSETVTLDASAATASFASSEVGTGIAVTVSGYAISGTASSNYSLSQPTGLTANITSSATPVISSTLIASSTYGNSFSYQITASNDPTSFNATGFPSELSIDTVTGILSGTPTVVGTYTISITATNGGGTSIAASLVFTIAPKTVTLTPGSALSKVYDRTTNATVSGASISGVVSGDSVNVIANGTFDSKNVGTAKTVTISYSLNGTAASKYVLDSSSSSITADITSAPLTVSGATASNKVYDGTNSATVSGSTLVGVYSGDSVSISNSGTFESINVGNGIAVTSTAILSGTDASNYSLTQPSDLTANITAASLTISGIAIANKTYDGTTAATITGTPVLSGIIGTDDVALVTSGATATFSAATVNTNISVAVSGYTLTGAAASNYTVNQPTGLIANITAVSKYYFVPTASPSLTTLAQWWSNTNGTGVNPANFTTASITYQINVNATTTAAWTVSGTGSKIVVGDGTNTPNLTIASGFAITGTIDVSAGATLTCGAATLPTFGALANTSTLNVISSSALALPTGTTTLGNLIVSNGAVLTVGSATSSRQLNINGNFDVSAGTFSTSGSTSTFILNFAGTSNTIKSSIASTYDKVSTISIASGANYSLLSDLKCNSGTTVRIFSLSGNLNISGYTLDLAINTYALVAGGVLTQNATSTIKTSNVSATPLPSGATWNGTVEYYSTSAQPVVAGSYYNLTITGASVKTPTLGTLTVAKNLTINTGATYTGSTNNPTLNVGGNFTNSGTFTQGTGTLTLNGTTSQTITNTGSFTNVTVNNAAGLVVATNLTISGALTLTSGVITTNSFAVIANGSVSRTSGHIAGNLRKPVSTATTAITYEIGGANLYRPIDFTFNGISVGGSLTASVSQTAGAHPNLGTSNISGAKRLDCYFTVSNSGVAFTSCDATFNFDASDVINGADTSSFIVNRYASLSWTAPTTGVLTSTSTKVTGLTAFGDFAFGEVRIDPTLVVSPSISFANQCVNTTSIVKTFTISGQYLTSDSISVGPLTGFSFSLNGISFTDSLSLTQSGGILAATTVYVQFTPTSTSSYTGNIAVSGGGAASVSVAITAASGINSFATATTGTASSITSSEALLAGSYAIGCSSIIDYGVEYSSTNNFVNGSGTKISGSGGITFTSLISGLSSNTTYYYKSYTTDDNGTFYGTQSSFHTANIDAPIATTATSITSSSFNANWGAVSAATNYLLDVLKSEKIAEWTFPTSGTTLTADNTSNANNTTSAITLSSGTISDVTGSPTRAASGTGWTTLGKNWEISLNTTGYYNLTISSVQNSSASGPRDFKLQYKIGSGGTYTDVPSGSITVANDYISGLVSNLALPTACENQSSVYIRWITTSTTNTGGTAVGGSGTSRIDNILVKGITPISGYNNLSVATNSKSVSGLTPSANYFYRVRANNATSTSVNSNLIAVTTKADETVADYRSKATGDFSDAGTWEYFDGASWSSASQAPTSANNITIVSPHEVVLTADITVGTAKTLTVNGVLNASGKVVSGVGTFALASGATIKLGDNVSLATAVTATTKTFDAGANYIYNGTVAQTTASLPGTITGNVTIANAAGVTFTANKTVNSPGTFAVNNNGNVIFGNGVNTVYYVAGTGAFSANSGSTFVLTNSNGITSDGLTGNIRLTGTRTFASGINYNFTKNDATTFLASNMGSSFGTEITSINNLTVNNPNGVILPTTVAPVNISGTPDRDITIDGVLTFTSGNIVTGTNKVIISSIGSVVRTSGHVVGNLQRAVAADISTIAFPIGDASNYTPVSLDFESGNSAGNVTVSTAISASAPAVSSTISQYNYIKRNWTLSFSATPKYSATFTYVNSSDIAGTPSLTALRVGKLTSGSWTNPTGSSASPSATTSTGLTSGGTFSLGGDLIPPVINNSTLTASSTYGSAGSFQISATNSPTSYNATAIGGGALPAGFTVDTATGLISVAASTAANTYTIIISATNEDGTGNATLTYTVNQVTVTITPTSGQSKTYGEADPTYTYTASPTPDVSITGALGRVAGENVNTYDYTLGDLSAGSNYSLVLGGTSTFAIIQATVTITPTSGQSKTYGAANPTYSYAASLTPDVSITGALGRVAGENVNTYDYTLGDLSAGGNYSLVLGGSTTFAITQATVTITPTSGQSKTYGAANPTYGYAASLTPDVSITGALGRVAGENVNTYAYTLGNLSAGGNYSLILGGSTTFAITPALLTITATNQSKCQGETFLLNGATMFTITPSTLPNGETIGSVTLISSGSSSGALAGSYSILPSAATGGTFSDSNYTITYAITGVLTVNPSLTPTITAGGSTSFCSGGNVVLTSSTGTSYLWSNGATTQCITVSTSGSYTVQITNSFGCTSPSSVATTVTVTAQPQWYLDADNDGYYTGTAIASCSSPGAGYTTSIIADGDCDDTKSSIRPNAVDICYDGIDNDCNGNVDNVGLPGGCTPKIVALQSASCGATVGALNTIVSATFIPGAQAFRFRITNMTTLAVQTLDSPTISFQFMNLPGVTFGTQYKIEVAVKFAGVWQGFYGSPCFVNTPSPVSSISSVQCGSTLTSMSQYINSSYVANVTGYRYEVTNQSNNQTQYVYSSLNKFTLTQLLASNQTFATNYFVTVACRNTDGSYLPEGPGCIVKSPGFPTTQVIASQCNNYLVPSMAAPVTVDPVSNATLYKFRLFNSTYDFVVESTFNRFTLGMFPGLEQGTLYSVQAAVQVGGVFDTNEVGEQKWGKTCTLTTPNAARQIETPASTPRLEVEVTNEFTALAYPNPFAENFKLDVTTNSQERLSVRVYDMLGKLVEDRNVSATDVETLEVGVNYPSGVYNVIVTQGENTKTLRVIKR
jgi:hypothetical protein